MKTLLAFVCFAAASPVLGQPLSIVNVQAPNVNFVFHPGGVVTVRDDTAFIWKSGFLQSRNFPGAAGAPAAGLYVYEYRIDLRNVTGTTAIPFIRSLTVDVGPIVKRDFNGDRKPDDVFVVTQGGLGTIGLLSAVRTGNTIEFTFSAPISGGGSPGTGQSSFFFGLLSKYPPHEVTASAANNLGAPLVLNARAPNHL